MHSLDHEILRAQFTDTIDLVMDVSHPEVSRLYGIDVARVVSTALSGLTDDITQEHANDLLIRAASNMVTEHPSYDYLAGRLVSHSIASGTPANFSDTIELLASRVTKNGKPSPAISQDILNIVRDNASFLNHAIVRERDYMFDYQGISTLLKAYLTQINGVVVETPQYMWMRVALGIHGTDLEAAVETYTLMSQKKFTHATPTLFNAGTPNSQLASCFLLHMHSDSVGGIYKTLTDCAMISQSAGGIGVHVHNVRAAGSPIAGTGGTSNGLVPMLRNFDATASYIDQGGGRRKGSFAIYLEPWHGDIFEFLDLKRNTGKDEVRARNLFYALWTPDLFMQRVKEDGDWTLMDPAAATGLSDATGDDFKRLYEGYEKSGQGVIRVVKAQTLWKKICEMQIETSMPYIMYKDAANRKSNQKNLGTIKSSNLCAEIVQYTSPDEIAVCNLASISLPAYITEQGGYNHEELHRVVKVVTRNLNKVIDRTKYPLPEARQSNLRHRPIGIGVQGLADVFMRLRLPWGSVAATQLNRDIFETIYHAAIEASNELANRFGAYETFEGSPASQGLFQFDLCYQERKDRREVVPESAEAMYCSGRYDWSALKKVVRAEGLRNSLLVALMPTASTANILDNTEAFEPIPSNIFKRNILSGEFVRINRYLVNDLIKAGLWNTRMKNQIAMNEGSIQSIEQIPSEMKELYRTVWEIPQRVIIDMAADRGAFVCQSQSMNIYMKDASLAKLTSMHFYGWQKGLKTGSYYIRQTAARTASKVQDSEKAIPLVSDEDLVKATSYLMNNGIAGAADLEALSPMEIVAWAAGSCKTDDPDGCIMCSG